MANVVTRLLKNSQRIEQLTGRASLCHVDSPLKPSPPITLDALGRTRYRRRQLDRHTDDALVAEVAAGDLAAFSVLYDRYAGRIHAWAAHVLGSDRAEDAIQEIFLLLWRRAGQFDPSRGSFAAWFMTLARHEILRQLRKQAASERVAAAEEIERLFELRGEAASDPADQAADRAAVPDLWTALREMPSEQRRALILAYFGGLSHSEIAEQLGLPLGTVKKRIRLAMAKLRAAVVRGEEDPPGWESTNQ